MSRSNHDKPFYVDVGTSIVAIRCASNHDVIARYDYAWRPHTLNLAKERCDRMNREAEIGRPRRNCDVGTAEEQIERFNEFCNSKWRDGSNANCGNCPLWVSGTIGHDCQIRWAQMPYEENESEVEK